MTDEQKIREKAEEMLAKLLSPIDPKLILKMDKEKGVLFIGDERPDQGRLNNLKAEAEFLLQTDLWKILYETPKALAEKTMFVSGETLDDLKKGRSMLYTLSVQKNIIDTFLKIIPKNVN